MIFFGYPDAENTASGPLCDSDGSHNGLGTQERGWSLQTHRQHSSPRGHELPTEVKDHADN